MKYQINSNGELNYTVGDITEPTDANPQGLIVNSFAERIKLKKHRQTGMSMVGSCLR